MRKSIHCCYLNQKIQHHLSSSDIEQDLSVTLKEISYKVSDSLNKDSEDLFAFAWLDAPSSDIDQYKKEFSQFSNRFFLHPITKLMCKPHNSSNNSSHQLSIGLHHAVLHKVNHSTSFLEDSIEKPELSIVSALKHCCDTFGINNRRWLDLYRSFYNTGNNTGNSKIFCP